MNESILQPLNELNLSDDHRAICIHVIAHVGVLLRYIQRGIPSFTDHGDMHSGRVLHYLRDLANECPTPLSSEDLMLLALSAVLHDIGCIAGRAGHSSRSARILSVSHFSGIRDMLTQESYRYLKQIIVAHSSEYDLLLLSNDGRNRSRLALLCCLFRLADGCDISSDRIPPLVLSVLERLKILDSGAKRIWRSHLSIEKVEVRGTSIVVRARSKRAARLWTKKLEAELDLINSVLSGYNLPCFSMVVEEVP